MKFCGWSFRRSGRGCFSLFSPLYSLLFLLVLAIGHWSLGTGLVVAQEETPFQGTHTIARTVPEGYEQVAQSAHLELHMHPRTAQLAIRDRRSSYVWLSTPPLPPAGEVPENLHGKFGSVFFAFFTRGQSTQMRREDSVTKVSGLQIDSGPADGVVVRYEMEALGFTLVLRYTLGPDYLDIAVDEVDLVESEENLIVALELLPYLGSAPYRAETSAYYVLPDGPGALTYIGKQLSYRKPYSAVTYGTDLYSFARPSEQRTPLPIYGIAHPEGAVLGVATVGAGETSIEAGISIDPMTFSRASIRLIYRRLTQFPLRKGVFKAFFETERVRGDRAMRFFFLAGEEADWVGMAQRFRRHLIEDRGLQRLGAATEPGQGQLAARPALRLRLVMGAQKPGLIWRSFVTATSFAEAAEIIAAYHDAGMTDLDVVLVGWESDGYEGNLPKRWPPDRHLGGVKGLARLAEQAHAVNARLFVEADYTLAFLQNGGFFPLTDGVIQPNLLPVSDLVASAANVEVPRELRKNRFFLNPTFATQRYLQREAPRLAELGVDGMEVRWSGELALKDVNPRFPLERTEFAQAWQRMLAFISASMGSASAQGGNGYVLDVADTVTQFPLYRSDYIFADETVPFYPVATHGLVRLYGEPTNLDSDPQRDFLTRLQYGMLPTYELTYRQPIVLNRTTYPELYSSHYQEWVERAAAEYAVSADQLGHTVSQFIIGRRQLAPQVFETTYEDGTQVIVNYADEAYEGDGARVESLGYLIRKNQ